MTGIPDTGGVAALRRFNRFYTRQIGVLRQKLLDTRYSLAEARVLYELAHREQPTATELGQALQLDAGYLSRMLRGFEQAGLLRRRAAPEDARRSLLSLSAAGRKAVTELEARSDAAAAALAAARPPGRRHGLDRASPRRAVRAGIRLGRELRSPGGGDRGRLRAPLRSGPRALLAGRARGRNPRQRLPGEGIRDRGAAAPVAGRAGCARPGHRPAPGGGVRPLRPPGRLPQADP